MGSRAKDENQTPARGGTPAVPPRGRSVLTYLLLFMALALFVDGIVGERGWFSNRRDRAELARAEAALAAKRLENAELRDFARRLQEPDPATIEDLARRELGYVRPGETVFIIRDAPTSTKK